MALTRISAALVALVALCALGSCSFERRSPDYTCVTADECHEGRVCSGGFCVDPSTVGDGGPVADGAPGDAFVCPAACTRCEDGVCVIDCNADSSCGNKVLCPAGMDCAVSCGRSACGAGVDCSASSGCSITCNQDSSCGGRLICSAGTCDIQCSGNSSCGGGIDCGASCHCDAVCTGSGACPLPTVCPGPSPCHDGAGCTSAPNACHSC